VPILIVDDSNLARIAMSNILRLDGLDDIHLVESGQAALEFLADAPDLDAILMDVVMPGMDGITTLRRIKELKALRDVPILMVSAGDDEDRIKTAFDAGAIDFVPKPIRRMELCARVRSALRLKHEMDQRKARERELEELNNWLHGTNLELAKQARTDGLTGLANRIAFDGALQSEWGRAAREERSLAVLLIDVDHFKAYNDRYGHPAGDECLARVGRIVRREARRPGDFVARYGGEEFIVLLPDTDLNGATAVAEQVRAAFVQERIPHAASTAAPFVTVSVGVAATVPRPSLGPGPLVENADSALYAAKHAGRNRVIARHVMTIAPPPPSGKPYANSDHPPSCTPLTEVGTPCSDRAPAPVSAAAPRSA
jgi:diguanylate cyclase (GGDEF)-like protein